MKKEKKEKVETKKNKVNTKKVEVKRGIVRIAGVDIPGETKLYRALWRVKGISFATGKYLSNIIQKELGIGKDEFVGNLSDDQIAAIDNLLYNLDSSKMPIYLMNRRKDIWDGKSYHLIMNDLLFATRMSIERKKKMYNWQGYRHIRGKKVRGQRTKNTGRKGMSVGVMRNKQQQTQQQQQNKQG
ncbi:MAG: 30S ribosomal protein S13 [Candidatus Micrarchaeota archaeon]|nr:30S ribosomal protein S13 [Candidatus Micrarchaeota archaeon]MCX8154581.1 30S ribosomal protein S13 [Candidatus Micrarchaeota archaeon]